MEAFHVDCALLEALPLFQGLSTQDVQLLAERFKRVKYAKGEAIFAQGDPANRIYIVLSGNVAIRFKPEDDEMLTVTEVAKDGVFGWSSVLGRNKYTSCAICLDDVEALSVQGDVLRKLCKTHPITGVIILERLAEVIAERLRNTHEYVIEMLQNGMTQDINP
jgi:CRP/FNR family cyclic AMP-dependent transcriptional regulator